MYYGKCTLSWTPSHRPINLRGTSEGVNRKIAVVTSTLAVFLKQHVPCQALLS